MTKVSTQIHNTLAHSDNYPETTINQRNQWIWIMLLHNQPPDCLVQLLNELEDAATQYEDHFKQDALSKALAIEILLDTHKLN